MLQFCCITVVVVGLSVTVVAASQLSLSRRSSLVQAPVVLLELRLLRLYGH